MGVREGLIVVAGTATSVGPTVRCFSWQSGDEAGVVGREVEPERLLPGHFLRSLGGSVLLGVGGSSLGMQEGWVVESFCREKFGT